MYSTFSFSFPHMNPTTYGLHKDQRQCGHWKYLTNLNMALRSELAENEESSMENGLSRECEQSYSD